MKKVFMKKKLENYKLNYLIFILYFLYFNFNFEKFYKIIIISYNIYIGIVKLQNGKLY